MIRYKASLKNDETGIKFLVGVLEYAERIGYDYILWDWLVIDNTYDYFQIGTSHFLAENRIPPTWFSDRTPIPTSTIFCMSGSRICGTNKESLR